MKKRTSVCNLLKLNMLNYYTFLLAVCAVMTTSCGDDNKINDDRIKTPQIEIDNMIGNNIEVVAMSVTVDTFPIKKELTFRVGTYIRDYNKVEDKLLVATLGKNNIACINSKGELLWEAIPPAPGIDRYSNSGPVEIDTLNREIYIENRDGAKIDVFDYTGEFIRTLGSSDFACTEFAILGRDSILYDIGDVQRQYLEPAQKPDYPLFRVGINHSAKYYNTVQGKVNPNLQITDSGTRFLKYQGKLTYREPFGRTVFEIGDDLNNLKPLIKFTFKYNDEFEDIILNPKTEYAYLDLPKERVPFPMYLVHDPVSSLTFTRFDVEDDFYFTIHDGNYQLVKPALYYNFDGYILPCPSHYAGDKFFLQLFRYEFDYLQSVKNDQVDVSTIKSRLKELQQLKGEEDDILVFELSFAK